MIQNDACGADAAPVAEKVEQHLHLGGFEELVGGKFRKMKIPMGINLGKLFWIIDRFYYYSLCTGFRIEIGRTIIEI